MAVGLDSPSTHLTSADRAVVSRALRFPRGRYDAVRASQLSAVPSRTLHDWATAGVLVPDWMTARPRGWSYRDVIYVRLLAWLRSKRMDRDAAAERVAHVRKLLATSKVDPEVASDGSIFLVGGRTTDSFTGQRVFDGVAELLDVFYLAEPVEGVSRSELWGPHLVRPSAYTYISPWVLAGEPCVAGSRIPSSGLYALHADRGLSVSAITELYPGTTATAVEDALDLEARLRRAA